MKKLLKSGWLIAAAGSTSFLITTTGLMIGVGEQLRPAKTTTPHEQPEKRRPIDLASWNYINPDIDELSRQLKDKQRELDQREADLEKVAEQIATEKRELAGVTNWVESIQTEIDSLFSRVEAEEAAKDRKSVV